MPGSGSGVRPRHPGEKVGLKGDTLVTWKSLKAQFGTNYKELYHFKSKWPKALDLALAVYPDAKVDVTDLGMILKPSRPPVAPRLLPVRQG